MVSIPTLQGSSVESTHLNVTNRIKTYVSGLIDAGKFTFEVNYSAAIYTKLKTVLGLSKPYKISSPVDEDQTFAFNAHLTKLELSFSPDELAKIKCEANNEGDITLGTIAP